MRLGNKKIVVVGGAGKIGREVCVRLLKEGAAVCVADIDVKPWESYSGGKLSKEELSRCYSRTVDVVSTPAVKSLVSYSVQTFGGVDAVVNCSYPRAAGLNKKLEDLSFEEFTENLKVHLGSFFLVSKEFALAFREQGQGCIVNFSSIYGIMTPRFELYQNTDMVQPITYAAVKAGIIQSSRYLAKYLKNSGIRVNCISPGGILDQQPEEFQKRYAAQSLSKGMLDPADVLGAVVFLVSDESQFLNGQNIVIDDGFSL